MPFVFDDNGNFVWQDDGGFVFGDNPTNDVVVTATPTVVSVGYKITTGDVVVTATPLVTSVGQRPEAEHDPYDVVITGNATVLAIGYNPENAVNTAKLKLFTRLPMVNIIPRLPEIKVQRLGA